MAPIAWALPTHPLLPRRAHAWCLPSRRPPSAAWASAGTPPAASPSPPPRRKRVVVIGGGWAGFTAADEVAVTAGTAVDPVHGVDVLLVDAAAAPGGLAASWTEADGSGSGSGSGSSSDSGGRSGGDGKPRPPGVPPPRRTVEAGIHGYWRAYSNVLALIRDRLGIPDDALFTPYTPSVLHSWVRDGGDNPPGAPSVTVTSPVFGQLPRLPTPLATVVAATYTSAKLGLAARASAVRLLPAWADFGDGGAPVGAPASASGWARWDRLSARSLFVNAGVSEDLYTHFLLPLLLVLPMGPGERISAAAALSCFSYFALRRQGDFDVRWLRGGSGALLFGPWRTRLRQLGVDTRFGDRGRVVGVAPHPGGGIAVTLTDGPVDGVAAATAAGTPPSPPTTTVHADAVIFAVGISGMQALVRASPWLGADTQFRRFASLTAVSVLAVRLWFSVPVALPGGPSHVCGGGAVPGLEDVGWTLYDLTRLQDEYAGCPGGVIEADFYHAAPLLSMPDGPLVDLVLSAMAALTDGPQLTTAAVTGVSITRLPAAVSLFTPGSFSALPVGVTAAGLPGVYLAGDWVDRCGHPSWSQEKACVTGLSAAAAAVQGAPLGLPRVARGAAASRATPVIPVAPAEPHVAAAGRAAAVTRGVEGVVRGLLGRVVPLPLR
ncbi:hypothetical protein MMPV_003160 [Pyropia vietnamensis]